MPKSVMNAKAAWTQPGSCFDAAASGASANTIASATRTMVASPAARTRARVPCTALKRGEAASTVIAALTLARAQRGQLAAWAPVAAPPVTLIARAPERKTAMIADLPAPRLNASMRLTGE